MPETILASTDFSTSCALNEFISFSWVQNHLATAIYNWLCLEEKCPFLCRAVHDFHSVPTTDLAFLSAFQAIESWHAAYKNERLLPTPEYAGMKKRVLESLQQNDREWLERKFPPNRIAMSTAISEGVGETAHLLGFSTDMVREIAEDAVGFRNALAHPKQPPKKTGRSFTELTGLLNAVVICLLLQPLNLPEEAAMHGLRSLRWSF